MSTLLHNDITILVQHLEARGIVVDELLRQHLMKINDTITCEDVAEQSGSVSDSTTHYVVKVGDGYVYDYITDSVTQLLRDFTLTNSLSEAYTTAGRSEAIDLAHEVGGLVYKL